MADNKSKKATIPLEQWAAFKRHDLPTEVNDLMRNAYLQYSVSANIGRAIPDVRDGLKPGARRILYAMLRGGFLSSGGLNKCAKVVGLVIGNYHPHGDSAVYETMVRLAQPFSMRVPLIHGHGNFGSMDGDPAAAYRYTECKMERAAEALLADLDKETIDMRETFDGKEMEPIVLPAAFPNLLVNGSQGIGVGMATNVPPHNLGEAIDAAVAIIDNPDITIDELMQFIPGPDYPTGGIIHGVAGIRKLYTTGQGAIAIRGKVEVETDKNGRDSLVITEIPYNINKAEMVARIGELVRANVIHGISDINDYSSSRVGVRIVINLRADATANVVMNELFKLSPLQTNDPGQLLVVDHNRPRTMTLRQILDAYIDHRENVITRRTQFLLRKAEERAHIVEGLMIAQANIDEVIRIIRNAADRNEAFAGLISRFNLDEIQANAILDMRLASLTHLAVDELQKELDELNAKIAAFKEILSCRDNVMQVVRKELLETKEKFNTPRRTRIEAADGELNLDGLTKREIYVITLTRGGYIKRCSADEYSTQNRGGSGVKGFTARKSDDTVHKILTTRSHNTLLFFTNYGRVYKLARAYELPEGGRSDAGRFIANVLQLYEDPEHPENHEEIRAIISYDEKTIDMENNFVVMVTKNGLIKRCRLSLFKFLRKGGKRALAFREDDDLIDAELTDGTKDLLISSKAGRAVRFNESQVRPMGNMAAGVRAIKLQAESDGTPGMVVSMAVVDPNDELLVITENANGKRTPIGAGRSDDAPAAPQDGAEAPDADADNAPDTGEEAAENAESAESEERSAFRYRLTNRGTRGCISVRLRPGDHLVAAIQIPQNCKQDLLLLTVQGQAVRTPIEQIRLCGRASYGVRVMRFVKENDRIANVSVVDELSEADAAANDAKDEREKRSQEEAAAFAENQAAQNAEADDTAETAPDSEATAETAPDAAPEATSETTPEAPQN
ncbi:MAG: DNA gyrase subunit A [Victivallales bacterium]|nr:DNA gyrase subunit A [Victivallales bacterium]